LNAGESFIEHIAPASVAAARQQGFVATTTFARANEADALILCVPTPLTKHREPDLSFVLNTLESLLPHLRPGQVVSLESTTYPGTTDEELAPRISGKGLQIGEDVFLVYSPEREDPGNPKFATHTIPKVVGGSSPACLEVGLALYSQVIERLVPVSSTRAAELTKLLENIHRAVNIGLVNEMKIVADKLDIDIHEVIAAAATKPFGFTAYQPGPGLGGHCIPIDPFYLTWKAREYGVHTRFIELAGEVNSAMPDYVMTKVAGALNDRCKPLKGSHVLVLGIAYKKNVDDMRESPAVVLMEKLRDQGAVVSYSDPHIPHFPETRAHNFDLSSVAIDAESVARFDCVLLATDHDEFDYELIAAHAQLIVDTRGRYGPQLSNLVRS
jgi:UDP-N-acetyl-D-glucosamine dehydrogenase